MTKTNIDAKDKVAISQKPVTSIQYKNITGKFDGMLAATMMGPSPMDVLNNREFFRYIMDGIKDLSEEDVLKVAVHFHKSLKSVITHAPSMSKIQNLIAQYAESNDDWDGRNFVGEENGQIFVMKNAKGTDKIHISNFILDPKYTVTVQGEGGKKFHIYNVKVQNDNKVYTLKLTAQDFDKLEIIQSEIKRQLANTSAMINGCSKYMNDVSHKYVTLANFSHNQLGTSLLGLERFEDNGPKYFCSPTGIYNLEGKISDDIVFMGNEESNQDEIKNYSNLGYNQEKWKSSIVPTFLRNIVHINDKWSMMAILGWMGSIPHDYVIRKEAGTGFFPHCHIIGEPGSGKSTIMTIFKQFMGHNDGSPRTFPTPFEISKLFNSSYTIPIVLDEYGKRWSVFDTEKINKILVEAFTRARWSRGKADLGSVYFKYKNPLLMGGQIPTSDQALATRIVPITIYKAYQNSKAGKKAFEHLTKIQKMEDKNFWVGYNLYCAQYTNEEVEALYSHYRSYCRNVISDNRVADIYATVMLGLYYMKQLALSVGITEAELGFDESDILAMANRLDKTSEATDSKETPLTQFLQELGRYAVSIGNSKIHGNYFGKGKAVMLWESAGSGAGQYGGRTSKQDACIYGKEMILVKVDEAVTFLNNNSKKKAPMNEREVMTFIQSEFNKSMQDPMSPENLVLAPRQYEIKYGRYTAFNKKELIDLYSEFQFIMWQD